MRTVSSFLLSLLLVAPAPAADAVRKEPVHFAAGEAGWKLKLDKVVEY